MFVCYEIMVYSQTAMKVINNNLIAAHADLAGVACLIASRVIANLGLGFQAIDRVRFAAGPRGLREESA